MNTTPHITTGINSFIRLVAGTLICLASLCSCTQVGGHIGPWFGQWNITAIDIDGKPDTDYTGNLYMSFQADIVRLSGIIGTWTVDDDNATLTLHFATDANSATPPSALHLPSGYSSLSVLQLSQGDITLRYVTPTEPPVSYTYYLKKWW
jgi:hypothetical protein